jgi:hypothetical protein
VADRGNGQATRSRVPFETLATNWKASVLPRYKHSTQKNHRHILDRHLVPRFGTMPIAEVTREAIQKYVADFDH